MQQLSNQQTLALPAFRPRIPWSRRFNVIWESMGSSSVIISRVDPRKITLVAATETDYSIDPRNVALVI
jgi:hypothetical protein